MSILVENKLVYREYNVLSKIEAGIKLMGMEVKAVKEGKCNLKGSYVNMVGEKVAVLGMHISKYSKYTSQSPYNPTRTRYLLLNNYEIKKVSGFISRKGYAVVPLKLYTKGDLVKLEIGLAQGLKKYEKKEAEKEKQQEKDLRQELRL